MACSRATCCRIASTMRRAPRQHFPSTQRIAPLPSPVAPSIAVNVALLARRPLPPLLVDCCRFHCHRHVAVHPPLLPSLLLCCACHRRPSPSRHPSPPSLVDCCIFHVHCRIAVHRRRSVTPTIAVNVLPTIAAVAVIPLHLPLPSPLGHHCAVHCR
jgi:hypothetical protein